MCWLLLRIGWCLGWLVECMCGWWCGEGLVWAFWRWDCVLGGWLVGISTGMGV